jgi:hypothetical protein
MIQLINRIVTCFTTQFLNIMDAFLFNSFTDLKHQCEGDIFENTWLCIKDSYKNIEMR